MQTQVLPSNHILLGITGTNVPDTTEKEIEDQVLGGCFPILLFFFFILGSSIFSIALLIKTLL